MLDDVIDVAGYVIQRSILVATESPKGYASLMRHVSPCCHRLFIKKNPIAVKAINNYAVTNSSAMFHNAVLIRTASLMEDTGRALRMMPSGCVSVMERIIA
jgi:hypothetical protein